MALGEESLTGLCVERRASGSAAYVCAEFRAALFVAPYVPFLLSLFLFLSRIVRFDPAFGAPRGANVADALGALGRCHALRLSPVTATGALSSTQSRCLRAAPDYRLNWNSQGVIIRLNCATPDWARC